jgi:peptidoglycan/LPS O-acetylase OafA/YrhL
LINLDSFHLSGLNAENSHLVGLLFGELCLAYPIIWAALYSPPVFRAFGKLGDSSYSLFLYHWPVLIAMMTAFPKFGFAPLFAVTYVVAISLAFLSWHLMENRALQYRNWTLFKKPEKIDLRIPTSDGSEDRREPSLASVETKS